jgi:DNA polymerase I
VPLSSLPSTNEQITTQVPTLLGSAINDHEWETLLDFEPQTEAVSVSIDTQNKKGSNRAMSQGKKILQADLVLREKLNKLFEGEYCELITNKEQLQNFLKKSPVFGLDTETTDLRWYAGKLVGFSLGTSLHSAYIPIGHSIGENYSGDTDELVELLCTKKYYGFNAKFDLLFMTQLDQRFSALNFIGDGYLAIRCFDNTLDAGLKTVYKQHIDPLSNDYSFAGLFTRTFSDYDPLDIYKYAAVDARKHFVVTEYFEEKLKKLPKVWKVYSKIEIPLIHVIADMERRGIAMDEEYIIGFKKELESRALPIVARLQELTFPGFNPSSPKQLKQALSDKGINVSSTNEETLLTLKGNEIIDLILELRGINKSISTFTENLLEYATHENGITLAHPGFNQYGADTGRFSSSKFNIQQIPKDNKFRKMFIARPGHTLISVDYSQQEVRVLAALSKDPLMLDAFRHGKDFYSAMGANIYNLPYEECLKTGKHKNIRQEMKGVVLGMNYDMQAESLGKTIGKTTDEAQKILEALEKKYSVMYEFKKKCLNDATLNGFNETVLGRRRHYVGLGYKAKRLSRFIISGAGDHTAKILEIISKLNRNELKGFIEEAKNNRPNKITIVDREAVQWSEQRQTTNSVVQGSSADMTKLAMLAFYNDPRRQQYKAEIVLQIHDEIIIEAPDEFAIQAGELLAEVMNGVGAEMMDGLSMGGEPGYMKVWQKD